MTTGWGKANLQQTGMDDDRLCKANLPQTGMDDDRLCKANLQ